MQPPGRPKIDLDRLLLQALDEGLGSGEFHGRVRSVIGRGGSWCGREATARKAKRPPGWEVVERTRQVSRCATG